MGLAVGDSIGRFEVVGYLGAGGMGEVYRARDPQLQRDVAIKVLPTALAGDADRQRRFEREARAAGGLNHPNIVAVHDVAVQDGATWIVTELLEGTTLRERLDGRPLSTRAVIDYATQIASGLAGAHERGIAHRDIKPANLFVTKDGRIKILDFGLAKLFGPDGDGDATEILAIEGTQRATVLGTAVYMSPEQVRGARTDHRSDIFSFGTVLYEMLAGFPPFRRGTTAETLAAIVHDEPPSAAAAVPGPLERLVLHCLEKDPAARFQSARDLVFALETVQRTLDTATAPAGRRVPWRVASALGAGVIGLSAIAGLAYLAGRRAAPEEAPAALYTVRRLTDFPGLEEFPAISPDRKSVAFTANVNGRRQIFVRLLAGGRPLPITTDAIDHQLPRWTPNASSIVYFAPAVGAEPQGAIWSIPALGGSPRRIVAAIGGADVAKDGRVACFSLVGGKIQLQTTVADGSDVHALAQFDAGYHRYPRWSPDGRWIAFERGDGVRSDVFVVSTHGGEVRQLTHDRSILSGLAWLPDSSGVVYASSRASTIPYLPPLRIWEARLDDRTARAITPPGLSYEQPDIDSSGRVAASLSRTVSDIWKFPFDAGATGDPRQAAPVTHQTGQVLTPTAAPDGDQVAYLSDSGGHSNVWVVSSSSGESRQITNESDAAVSIGVPIWSPDGSAIGFVSSKGLTGYDFGLWLVNPDGSNLRQLATHGLGMAWSKDGRWVYYADTSAGALQKIPASGGAPVTVRKEPTRNVIGVSGRTLYYVVERPLVDGRPEFEIRSATPEDGPSRLMARIPASRIPSWQIVNPSLSPDGQWLALPLTDGFTTNVWALSTTNMEWRRVTDFGDRAIFIARRVSWSADGKSILASIAEGDADIVLIDSLIPIRGSHDPRANGAWVAETFILLPGIRRGPGD